MRVSQKTIPLAVLTVVLEIAGSARSVEAQESVFLAVVRDLTSTPVTASVARERMTAALAQWDREIDRLERQVGPQASGVDSERAFRRHVELGLMYRRRGRLGDALRHFGHATELRPDASDVHLLRALTFEAAGHTSEAGRALRAAWARDAASPVKAYLVLGQTRDLEPADEAHARQVLHQAYSRILSGSYRAPSAPFLTLDLVPDASSVTPIAGDATRARVFARLAAGRLDEAAALGDPGPDSPDDSALARISRGQTAEREGRLSDARHEYAAALDGTLAGRHALYVGIARLAQVEGDLDTAIDAFGHAVRLSPNDPALRRELASALVATDRFDDAFAELVAALLIAPDNADVLAAVGQMFLDTERPVEAIAPLRRALTVKADRHETHYALAVALSRAGWREEAAREFELFERFNQRALENRRRIMAGQAGLDEAKQ